MFHVIDNPTAGKKGHKKNIATLERVFQENNVDYTIHTTTHKGGGREVVEQLTADGGKDIVVVGGDGTIHEVLNGMKDPRLAVWGLSRRVRGTISCIPQKSLWTRKKRQSSSSKGKRRKPIISKWTIGDV